MNYINLSAAQRILGHTVTKIWMMPNGAVGAVYIKSGKKCSTLVSVKKFQADFVEFRKMDAKSVTVNRWEFGSYRGHYDATSNGKIYTVRLLPSLVSCSCGDFKSQVQAGYSKPVCKHVLAVVQSLNVSSFSEAIAK